MRFTSVVTLALAGAAAASPVAKESTFIQSGGAVVEKRLEPISTAILTAAGTAAATALVDKAVAGISSVVKGIANFESAREEFTKKTTADMWANADKAVYSAAVCYNQAYDLENPAGMDGPSSVELRSGPLRVDFDCFMIKAGPNALFTRGDGGFQNLAIAHDNRCTFDSKTADLRCN